jgi:hypothetical protein
MFSLKVGQAEQYLDIAQNETRIRVPFSIVEPSLDYDEKPILDEDGNPTFDVVEQRIESFPLLTTEEEVRETLQRHLAVFISEAEQAEANIARQAEHDHGQEVADSISNIEIQV